MSRIVLLATLALAAFVPTAWAQFEVGARGGVHIDRSNRADRLLTDGGAAMFAAAGEASALGGHVGYWLRPTLGLQLDLSRSSNSSWEGSTPLPPPSFANRTTYLSARAVIRTAPRRFQLFFAAGPALMFHGGSGANLRTRDTDIGGVLEAGARLRLAGRLGMQLGVSDYLYGSRYASAPNGGTTGSAFQNDVMVTTGLVLTWP